MISEDAEPQFIKEVIDLIKDNDPEFIKEIIDLPRIPTM